jgi:enoyl-CoA hydratase/carnithine racemase
VNDAVAVVTLNNPKALNALTGAMGDEFTEVVAELCGRTDVAAVVITGAGRAFSAGGDLEFLTDRAFNSTPEVNTATMQVTLPALS